MSVGFFWLGSKVVTFSVSSLCLFGFLTRDVAQDCGYRHTDAYISGYRGRRIRKSNVVGSSLVGHGSSKGEVLLLQGQWGCYYSVSKSNRVLLDTQ